jgi:hypothetical protein
MFDASRISYVREAGFNSIGLQLSAEQQTRKSGCLGTTPTVFEKAELLVQPPVADSGGVEYSEASIVRGLLWRDLERYGLRRCNGIKNVQVHECSNGYRFGDLCHVCKQKHGVRGYLNQC